MTKKNKYISKYLSYILRHHPDDLGINLDAQGWTSVEILLQKINEGKGSLTFQELEEVVATNSKQRFSFNADKTQIKANQGHSVSVDLNLEAVQPPTYLYHGTVAKFLDSIKENGILKGSRHHVHLSENKTTATDVGSRRGKPVILTVKSGKMHEDGYLFYCTENKVWLTDMIPSQYIEF